MSRYGVSESTSSAGSSPGQSATSVVPDGAGVIDVLERRGAVDRRRLLEASSSIAHRPCRGATSVARRDHDLRLAARSRCATAGAAKPEKIGTWIAPEVRARVRGDRDLGRHRQEDRDAVARADAERGERLGEARHLARHLGEGQLAARAVLAASPTAATASGVRSAQRCTQFQAMFSLPPANHVAHSRPARDVHDRVPRLENSSPMSSIAAGQNHVGVVLASAGRAPGSESIPCRRMSRMTFARSRTSGGGLPDDLGHGAKPMRRASAMRTLG